MRLRIYAGAFAAIPAAVLAACVVADDRLPSGGGVIQGGPVATDGGAVYSADGAPLNSGPMLVDVDTGQVMTAAPGDGVGVFVEYASGGHWHLWWTCDTNRNPQHLACPFDISVAVATGAFSNVSADAVDAGGAVSSADPQHVEAQTTTSTSMDGILFDSNPGAAITVDAKMGTFHDGSLFFFVQNGKINGGFAGKLTDPLMFEGSAL